MDPLYSRMMLHWNRFNYLPQEDHIFLKKLKSPQKFYKLDLIPKGLARSLLCDAWHKTNPHPKISIGTLLSSSYRWSVVSCSDRLYKNWIILWIVTTFIIKDYDHTPKQNQYDINPCIIDSGSVTTNILLENWTKW
jgi:hypothetical protein